MKRSRRSAGFAGSCPSSEAETSDHTGMPAVALAALRALVALPALSQTRLYAAAPERFANVTVVAGLNLWTIADRYTSADGNVQDTVDQIMAANNLQSSTVIAGEHLKIPR